MRFQPGQSGNPAGRPPGSRNQKTLEAEEMLAARAEATVAKILDRADAGEPAAMRLCMDRIAPTGANRRVPIELPPVEAPDDVAAAARVVTGALAQGAVTAREAISLLTVLERLARIAERVQQMRERHWVWREGAASRTSVKAAAGGEGAEAEALYSPVNSGNGAGQGTSAPDQTEADGLYFPVNSTNEAAADALDATVRVERASGKASGSLLRRRRRALMTSVAPKALLVNETGVDPRSYVTEQTWLAEMLRNETPGAMKRKAA